MKYTKSLPAQQLSFSAKTVSWRKKHLDWAEANGSITNTKVRKSILHKKINYDLVNGKLNMEDCVSVVNPSHIEASYIPESIQHYPIINSKLNILRGEEMSRRFDFRVICTNPNAISEIEENKTMEFYDSFKKMIEATAVSEEELKMKLQALEEDFKYSWQDVREIRANSLLKHYIKELGIQNTFNEGFLDAMIVGEEVYQTEIISGEPTFTRLNPMKVRMYQSGYSNKVEDADIIVLEDYWAPGRIIDYFYDSLKASDVKYLEELPNRSDAEEMDNIDERKAFIRYEDVDENAMVINNFVAFTGYEDASGDFDSDGNVKVLRVYWKSRRKIKKVKSYDPQTGEILYNFYPETYVLNENLGEEEEIFWVNEAWEGTKVGKIYLNMHPRPVQYNRMSNPSRCHFGIVGRIYSTNEGKPFSLVDMMKPLNYLYDVVHDRLNKAMEANWGMLMEMDLASVPTGWTIDKWMYYAKTQHLAVKDSFKEGNVGAATGKLAGNMANNSRGIIGNDAGNYIQQHVNLLEFIKLEMSEIIGISRQREGQVSNRETVGGVERATLQSSHITEYIFNLHNEAKKSALEAFLETAKIALKGKKVKFQYILSDYSLTMMEFEGDEFSENDYGLIVDNSAQTQELISKMDMLAQAALQNQLLDFSTIMKIYTNVSMSETQRMIEKAEADRRQMMQQQAQQAQALEDTKVQAEMTKLQMDADLKRELAQLSSETALKVKQMEIEAKFMLDTVEEDDSYSQKDKAELLEKMREFDKTFTLEKEKLALQKEQLRIEENLKTEEIAVKRIAANKPKSSTQS